jgi:O-antigen ligase
LIGFIILLCFLAVLFADFLPSFGGSYADQRFLLAVLIGSVLSTAIFFLLFKGLSSKTVVGHLLPSIAFCLSFPVLSFTFWGQAYAFVEPGLYAFYFAAIFCGGLALVMMRGEHNFLETFVVVAAFACFFYGAMSVNVYLFALVDGQAELSDFIPWGFVNIRYWSHVATWLLPILPLAVLVGPLRRYRLWRSMVAIGAGLWWWIVLISASRGSTIGVVSGVFLVTLFFGRQSWPWLKQCIVYFLVGVAAWLVLSLLIPSLFFGDAEFRVVHATSSGRLPLFIEAWHMSVQHFPFGMGPQSWLTHDLISPEYSARSRIGHPHNMYLMWAAEYGWLLVLLLLLLTVQLAVYLWQQRSRVLRNNARNELLFLCGFTTSVFGALVHAGVSAVFIAPGSMLIGMLVLTSFWALILPREIFLVQITRQRGNLYGRLVFASMTAAAVLTIWLLWMHQVSNYYGDMRVDESAYKDRAKGPVVPRFWLHGNFPREVTPRGSQE